MKKKLVEDEGAKNVTEWAKDEALRANEEAVFTQATIKAQVPGVCRLYCSQI